MVHHYSGMSLQKILTLAQDEKIVEILKLAIEMEQKDDEVIRQLGWQWNDVRADHIALRKLVLEGIVEQKYKSRSSTHYKLVDKAATEEALKTIEEVKKIQQSEEPGIPSDLFSTIVGYDDIKHWFIKSLNTPAEQPVHIVLIGPPASAKSLFMGEIARISGASYYSGTAITRAGVQRFIIDMKPKILVIDELDKMDEYDQAALYNVMETGLATELKANRVRSETVHLKVYGAGNSESPIGEALRSRFLRLHLRAYNAQEYMEVVLRILTTREHRPTELAQYIGQRLFSMSRDPRTAIQVGRLCETQQQVDELLETMRKYH